jgi:hypothetical protein
MLVIHRIIVVQLVALCHRRFNMASRKQTSADGRKCRQPQLTGLLELAEQYAPAEEGHHPQLIGWKTSPVAGIDRASLETLAVTRHICWPPMLLATLENLGAQTVFILQRPGTMVRYFVEGK